MTYLSNNNNKNKIDKKRFNRFLRFWHLNKMGELSGFGGAYELTCKRMLFAGLEYLSSLNNNSNNNNNNVGANVNSDNNGDKDKLIFKAYANLFGYIEPSGAESKKLYDIVVNSVDDCTGAMVHKVMSDLVYISKNGLDNYVKAMSININNNNNKK